MVHPLSGKVVEWPVCSRFSVLQVAMVVLLFMVACVVVVVVEPIVDL